MGRIRPGGDDVPRAAQHVAQRLLGTGQATGHGDLGSVQHDVVRQVEGRPHQSERDCRIEHHEVSTDTRCHLVDARDHPRVRQQNRFTRSFDVKRLHGIERCRSGVRTGQHRERVGRQASPPFPEQRLDATDLRWEVVGDEQVLHHAAVNSSATLGSVSPGGSIASRPSRLAAQTA